MAGLAIIGGLSILAFTKSFGTIFLGNPRTVLQHKPKEVSFLMLFPQYFIIVLMLSIAFFPSLFLNNIYTILANLQPNSLQPSAYNLIAQTTSRISLYSLILGSIIILTLVLRSLTRNPDSISNPTWGCGYIAPNNHMQYTGKSFSKPLGKAFSFLLIEKKQYKELNSTEFFPSKHRYKSSYSDFFEHYIIKPVSRRMVFAAKYFSFIQNGRVQSYVIYGILFILIVFLITVFNII